MDSLAPAVPAVSADVAGVMRLYRTALPRCWLPGALLAALWTGLLALLVRSLSAQDDIFLLTAQLQERMSTPAFWQLLLGATVLSTVLFCALVAGVHAVATGRTLGTGEAMVRALRSFPAALAAATIYMALTSLGTLLFVIPGAWLWGMWQLWVVALMAEGGGPLAALASSWRLTRGFWWPAVTLTTLATLASFLALPLANLAVSIVLAGIGLDAGHALNIMLAALAVVASLVMPLLPAALVAVYVDRQRRAAIGAEGSR
jgi:hypothetical protein